MIDTVCFLTPKIPSLYVEQIKRNLMMYRCVDCTTGEIVYEFSTGSVKGSMDSTINLKINPDNTLKITCSIHKVILGYNIAYGSDNLILLANCLKKILKKSLGVKLPDVMLWELQRLDYTLTFNLDTLENVENYVNSLQHCGYARRKAKHFNNETMQVRGATTIVKFYNKQKEFIDNDFKKIKKLYGQEKAENLIDLASGLLRVEVTIFSRKIKNIFPKTLYRKKMFKEYKAAVKKFGRQSSYIEAFEKALQRNKVTLKDFKIDEIIKVWESEVLKVIKDKNNTTLINKDNLVLEKLKENFSTRKANGLFSFWTLLSTRGEDFCKSNYKKTVFYGYRKDLVSCGISWKDTNIYINTDHKVISFVPSIDSPFLYDLNKPNYEFKEKVYNLLRGA